MARALVLLLVVCLLADVLCVPAGNRPGKNHRPLRGDTNDDDAPVIENESSYFQSSSTTSGYDFEFDDEDDNGFANAEPIPVTSNSGGSNIVSLLNLATALLPSASGNSKMIRNMARKYFERNPIILRRQDVADNVIEVDYVNKLTPPFQRQENDDSNGSDESDDHESDDEDDDDTSDDHGDAKSESEENKDNAAEESVENNQSGNEKASKQDSGLNDDDDSDSDYSDDGDGQGGGVLGLLAGLSGGEDGQSDLGSLLAAVSQIAGSLSGGEDFDLNSLIATGFGLFIGLLSQGDENPGEVLASYLLTSLDTLTEGGAQNNGNFFGKFLSTLIKGTSVGSSSTDSSSGQQSSPLWDFKMSILRAILQFGASIIAMASQSFTRAVTT